MKKKILFLLILFMPFMVSAYELEIEWEKNLDSDFDIVNLTSNNNFLVHNFDDVFYLYDKEGSLVFKSENSNISDSYKANYKSVYEIDDDGYVAVGNYVNNYIDALIAKYDKNGKLMWTDTYSGSNTEESEDYLLTHNDGIIAFFSIGSFDIPGIEHNGSGSDILIVKYDLNGNILWQSLYGGNSHEELKSVFKTEDDGFILAVQSDSNDIQGANDSGNYWDEGDAIFVKYDKNGKLLWESVYGGNETEEIISVVPIKDGGFITLINTKSTDLEGLTNKGGIDSIIIKYNENGKLEWQKSYGGSKDDRLFELILTEDGEYIAHGISYSKDINGINILGDRDAILLRYDKNGNLKMNANFGIAGEHKTNYNEIGKYSSVIENISVYNNKIYLSYASYLLDDCNGIDNTTKITTLVQLDFEGNITWEKNFNFKKKINKILSNNNELMVLMTFSDQFENNITNGEEDIIFAKYDNNGNLLWFEQIGDNKNNQAYDIYFFPNAYYIYYLNAFTDSEGMLHSEKDVLIKYFVKYELDNIPIENGTSTVEQQGSYGIVKPIPNEGYEVDKVIVKDKSGNVLDVEVTKLEDGTYSFELYTDVSVEVLFKEKLVNPKTGVSSFIGVMFTLMLIGISGFFMIRNCNNSYEL